MGLKSKKASRVGIEERKTGIEAALPPFVEKTGYPVASEVAL